jgi:hypothetical protein
MAENPSTTNPSALLVQRLRDAANGLCGIDNERGDYGLCDTAADEIERLREALRNIERVKAHPDKAVLLMTIAAVREVARAALTKPEGE